MRRSPSAALEEDIVVKTLISRGVFDWGWKNDWDIRDIYQNCGLDNNLIEWTDVDFRDWGSFGVFSQGEQTRLKKELVKALCNPSGMQADLGAEVRQIEQTDPRVGLRGQSGLFVQSPPPPVTICHWGVCRRVRSNGGQPEQRVSGPCGGDVLVHLGHRETELRKFDVLEKIRSSIA
jgi:hypothetical protein